MSLTTLTPQVSRVVFVDARITDATLLVASAAAGELRVLLDEKSDGLSQITAALVGLSGIESIHILAYGSEGALVLGKTLVNEATLGNSETTLQSIGASLSDTADVLVYGGNVAAGTMGVQFLQALASSIGADVAASDDASGGTGDFDLEFRIGTVDASALDLSSYTASLSAYTGAPLSGILQGSTASDYYFGSQDVADSGPLFDVYTGIRNLTVVDPGGNDVIRAENLFGRRD